MCVMYAFLLPVRKYRFENYSMISNMPSMIHSNCGMDFYVYAVTDNKKYANRFKKERDMSKFLPISIDCDNEKERDNYNGSVLELTAYESGGGKYVEVLSTSVEYDIVSDAGYTIFEDLAENIDPRSIPIRMSSLKKNYADALRYIGVGDLAFTLEDYFQCGGSGESWIELSKFKIYCNIFSELYKG